MSEATAEARADFDEALARAFSRIGAAKKDTKSHHGKYADLASVSDAIREALTGEGFSWPQCTSMNDEMTAVVVTTHLRRRGVELTSTLTMPIGKDAGPQQVGSAITYARRYSLAALTGVAPEEDDGQAAQDHAKKNPRKTKAKPKAKPEQKPGGWRANASADVLKADEVFRDLCKKRGALQRELEISREAMPNNPDRIVKILGREMPANPAEMPLDDWAQLNSGLRGDVEDLERTKLEKQAEEAAQ